jgi:ribosome maturation factor RimP
LSQALEAIVISELEALEFDLVELRRGGTRSRPVFDVRIDRRDGTKVTVDDCARASRAIEARLDADETIAERYVLEVSSPGAERPLKTARDWQRFVGRRANVTSTALGGRQEVEIVAVETAPDGDVALLRDAKGNEHRVPLTAVTEARSRSTGNRKRGSDCGFGRHPDGDPRADQREAARPRRAARAPRAGHQGRARKKYGPTVQSEVRIDGDRGTINITLLKTVVDEVTDPASQVTVDEARFMDEEFQPGDVMEIPLDFAEFGGARCRPPSSGSSSASARASARAFATSSRPAWATCSRARCSRSSAASW